MLKKCWILLILISSNCFAGGWRILDFLKGKKDLSDIPRMEEITTGEKVKLNLLNQIRAQLLSSRKKIQDLLRLSDNETNKIRMTSILEALKLDDSKSPNNVLDLNKVNDSLLEDVAEQLKRFNEIDLNDSDAIEYLNRIATDLGVCPEDQISVRDCARTQPCAFYSGVAAFAWMFATLSYITYAKRYL